jgi:hypothetical protein
MNDNTGTGPARDRLAGPGQADHQDWPVATALGVVVVVAAGVWLAAGPGSSGPVGPGQPAETVSITTARARDVLVVPAAALLARSSGGYAVEVVTIGRRHLVPVTPGLFEPAAGLVQVAGNLTPGQRVVVPGP